MFQDAPMFAISPSYSLASNGSDDVPFASFCYCGNEVEADEEGDVGIYCSVSCARQDALSSLTSSIPPALPPSASLSRTTSNASSLRLPQPLGILPSSLSNSTLRPTLDTSSLHSSNSSKTVSATALLGPSLSAEQSNLSSSTVSSTEHLSQGRDENSPIGDDEEGDEEVDWQASHYRRMERERIVMLEKRRRDRDARKLASANAKALAELKAQYLEQQHQQQQDRGLHQHRQQQASTSSIESYYAGGDASSSSLSRSTTSSSTTSSTSSSRFISTHPSRSRTPDLLPSGGQHGRNESLASTISTRSSASGSGWGWIPRLGWGGEIGAATSANGGDVIAEEEEEGEEEEEVERIRVPLRNGKGKEREEWGTGAGGKGMAMSDVLNEILEMEKGFVVGGLGSPPHIAGGGRDTWTGTPPRMGATASTRESATPTGRKLGLGLALEPRTPSRRPTFGGAINPSSIPFPSSVSKGTKRSHAQTPPSPPSNSHHHSQPHGRAIPHRTSFGSAHHRRTISSPSFSSKMHNHRTVLSLPFNIDEDDGHPPQQRRQRRSGSPLPPPSAVFASRPRTLVYSPRSDSGRMPSGGSQRSLSTSPLMEDFDLADKGGSSGSDRPESPPLLPPPSRRAGVPTSPSNSFRGEGTSHFSFPPINQHPTSASLLVLLDHSPPPSPSSTIPRSESMTFSQTTSIYQPTSPTLGLTTSFFHEPNQDQNSASSSEPHPFAQSVLAPPLFPSSPTPGTPEMVRMPERSGARLRALMAMENSSGAEMDWRMGGEAGEGDVTPMMGKSEAAWGDVEVEMEVDEEEDRRGKLGWMPTWLEAEGWEEGA